MIVIVIDSTACMTRQEARGLGVVCVPMTYSVDGAGYTEHFIDADGDYERRITGKGKDLKTSQASIDAYYKLFRGMLDSGFDVLCLTISSRLSGTYSNASVCAREIDPQRIRVIDTKTTAGGMYILAKEARHMIDGGMTLDGAEAALPAACQEVQTLFSVSDMGPLRRSGRLGPVRQSVGSILNIRPLLTLRDGAVEACGMARGRNEQHKAIVDAVPAHAEDVVVHYISLEEEAQRIRARLEEKCGRPVAFKKIGPVLGIHLGTDILSAMWRVKSR